MRYRLPSSPTPGHEPIAREQRRWPPPTVRLRPATALAFSPIRFATSWPAERLLPQIEAQRPAKALDESWPTSSNAQPTRLSRASPLPPSDDRSKPVIVMVIVRPLSGEIIGSVKFLGKLTEIEDDPVPCRVLCLIGNESMRGKCLC